MSALTVSAITKALSGYVRPDEDIVAKLNFVMPRLYTMGMWRDLLFDWSVNTDNDYFSLPEHADGLLGSMLNNTPVEAQSQWHDYRIGGYADGGPSPIFGVVDDGYHPIKEDITYSATANYLIKAVPVSGNANMPTGGDISLELLVDANSDYAHNRVDDSRHTSTYALDGAAAHEFFDSPCAVQNISYSGVAEPVLIIAENDADATDVTILAEVRGDGVARYRRFRFANPSAGSQNVKLLLKRAWQPVMVQSDIVHLGNINAIKHGLLGLLAEDNADLERAQYHWAISQQLLEEELDSARGAAKPKLRINPSGTAYAIHNAT